MSLWLTCGLPCPSLRSLSSEAAYAQCCLDCLETCDLERDHCDASCECVPNESPVIIDTTGDGFHLTSAADG